MNSPSLSQYVSYKSSGEKLWKCRYDARSEKYLGNLPHGENLAVIYIGAK